MLRPVMSGFVSEGFRFRSAAIRAMRCLTAASLLAGDLKGLKRTAEWKNQQLLLVATTREMQLAQWQEYTRLYGKLGNAAVPIALALLRNLSTRGGAV